MNKSHESFKNYKKKQAQHREPYNHTLKGVIKGQMTGFKTTLKNQVLRLNSW